MTGLVDTTVRQINQRATHLPDGMQQQIRIDITGQNVSEATQISIKSQIAQRSNGALSVDDINFFTRSGK